MLLVSLWVCVARHAQSAQNITFTIFCQYLKKPVNDEVYAIILGVCGQA